MLWQDFGTAMLSYQDLDVLVIEPYHPHGVNMMYGCLYNQGYTFMHHDYKAHSTIQVLYKEMVADGNKIVSLRISEYSWMILPAPTGHCYEHMGGYSVVKASLAHSDLGL